MYALHIKLSKIIMSSLTLQKSPMIETLLYELLEPIMKTGAKVFWRVNRNTVEIFTQQETGLRSSTDFRCMIMMAVLLQ